MFTDSISAILIAVSYQLSHPGKTRNKMRVAIESGKGMKVKVVKLC